MPGNITVGGTDNQQRMTQSDPPIIYPKTSCTDTGENSFNRRSIVLRYIANRAHRGTKNSEFNTRKS